MTRKELEAKVAEKLWEINKLIYEYNPQMPIVSIGIDKDYICAFALRHDKEKNKSRYLLNVTQRKEG